MDLQALELAYKQALAMSEAERREYLKQLGVTDPALAVEVGKLLRNATLDDAMLSEPIKASAEALSDVVDDPWLGRELGAYRVVRRIAVGGMGAVFLAERSDAQFEQRVAIKVMAAQLLSPDAIERFITERQLLANLQHPYIAQLRDGGTTEEGLPYLIMEYVDGLPIDAHCDAQSLSVIERLSLFMKAVQAVDFAHRNLIVHRDIKPSNILVTADGSPKLLDFGIAKLVAPEDTAVRSDLTQPGRRMLTLDYASPEQVRAERVTTATDVYSLGVLLYRLLTGQSPYAQTAGDAASMESQILDALPDRPSSRITSEYTTDVDIVKTRSTTLGRLRRRRSGELDNIVLMALRKEPERRYRSAAAMMDDIQRYLQMQPVIARADTWWYRGQKFVRRNALSVTFGISAFVMLGGFAAYTTIQNQRIAAERDVANTVSSFLIDTFDAARPEVVQGETVTAEQVLDASDARIAEQLADQPEIQARLSRVMGDAYISLGVLNSGIASLERAVDLGKSGAMSDYDLAVAASSLGNAYSVRGDFDKADEILAFAQELIYPLRDRGPYAYAKHRVRYGNHLETRGKPAESLEMLLDAAELGSRLEQDPDGMYPDVLHNLGVTYLVQGNLKEAETFFNRALATNHPIWGEGRKERAITTGLLGRVLQQSERYEEALGYVEQTRDILANVYGPEHQILGPAYGDLARIYAGLNRFPEAEAAIQRALDINRARLGDDHYNVAITYSAMGTLQAQQGRYEKALSLAEQSLAIKRKTFADDHPGMAITHSKIGDFSRELGDYDKALVHLNAALRIQRAASGDNNIRVANYLIGRAKVHQAMANTSAAFADADLGLQIHAEQSPPRRRALALREVTQIAIDARQCERATGFLQRALDEWQQSAESEPDWADDMRTQLQQCEPIAGISDV